MPYIRQKDKDVLDSTINKLAGLIHRQSLEIPNRSAPDSGVSGLLNYTITRLVLKVVRLRFGILKYWIICMVSGMLKNVSTEFYERLGRPYEDKCIEKNGDVDLYKEFEESI